MDKLTDTHQITACDNCVAIVKVLMDGNGNRFCGRCKRPVKSMEQISKEYDKRGYGISVGEQDDKRADN